MRSLTTKPLAALLWLGAFVAAAFGPAGALAQDGASKAGPPAGFVAPAEPKPDESNAQRARTQPGNNSPFWRAVRDDADKTNSMPGPDPDPPIQAFVDFPGVKPTNAGEAWRQMRNQWIIPYGGSLLALVGLAVALFYWRRGPLGGHEPDTGRTIERFTYFERAAHWTNAITFCVLAISGIVMAFGKFFLLPFMGATLFGWLTYALKTAHNFAGPLFAVSLVIVFLTFVRDNLPAKGDLEWLRKAGGLLGKHEVPSHRFNAGEKLIFWAGVFLLGVVVVGSGLVLDKLLPGIAYTRGNMQVAHIIHAVASVLMMAMFIGHIYLGTVGMKGAFQAMRTGVVDEAWAKEHHAHWHADVVAGKIPRVRSADASAGGRVAPQP